MVDAHVLSASSIKAIAHVQANYGVPDRWIAHIAQCSQSQIARLRNQMGWTKSKVTLTSLRKQALELSTLQDEPVNMMPSNLDNCVEVQNGRLKIAAVKERAERLLWRLTEVFSNMDADEVDPHLPKHVDAIGVAIKHLERLEVMRNALASVDTASDAERQNDPVETARVLRKLETRVQDLAERTARDIVNAGTDGRRSPSGGAGMDVCRKAQSGSVKPA